MENSAGIFRGAAFPATGCYLFTEFVPSGVLLEFGHALKSRNRERIDFGPYGPWLLCREFASEPPVQRDCAGDRCVTRTTAAHARRKQYAQQARQLILSPAVNEQIRVSPSDGPSELSELLSQRSWDRGRSSASARPR